MLDFAFHCCFFLLLHAPSFPLFNISHIKRVPLLPDARSPVDRNLLTLTIIRDIWSELKRRKKLHNTNSNTLQSIVWKRTFSWLKKRAVHFQSIRLCVLSVDVTEVVWHSSCFQTGNFWELQIMCYVLWIHELGPVLLCCQAFLLGGAVFCGFSECSWDSCVYQSEASGLSLKVAAEN